MNIKFIEIQNFRKLKACRVDLSERETIFVGANNSGKTSAMDAMRLFLKEKSFSIRDFTLSNWMTINELAKQWLQKEEPDLSMDRWYSLLPQLDIWIQVDSSELHYVNHMIPTLDWTGGLLGVRLCLEPRDIANLCRDFKTAMAFSQTGMQQEEGSGQTRLKIWPSAMSDFLDKELSGQFEVKAYLLDPTKVQDCIKGTARPQKLPAESIALEVSPFNGLIKIDIINAQRGFSDVNADGNISKIGSLSVQLRQYYQQHLDPTDRPVTEDLEALRSIQAASDSFDGRLKERFTPSLAELESLNYPGFGNPRIAITSKINAVDGLNHQSAVQFGLLNETEDADYPVSLPEKYNGLGYQNLISMVFKLMRFRDEWMKVGKKATPLATEEDSVFEPLHLVLIEEPEAHLHAQVQQVFIREAYKVLRKHAHLGDSQKFCTQLVISTHSNHIAHEIEFSALRYFKRNAAQPTNLVPTSCVVNLSTTFGSEDESTKFAIRYLKTTHCDLFFADAVILIEGSAERVLLPHFIRNHYSDLVPSYISILEIGGSHAHKLKPLIEDLGIITLVITDIDSVDPSRKSVRPQRQKGYQTNNNVLKSWLPGKTSIDDLIDLPYDQKLHSDLPIRVAYQHPLKLKIGTKKSTEHEVIPYTFEDSLVFRNFDLFKTMEGAGMIKKFRQAAGEPAADAASAGVFDALENAKKAEFALDLLYVKEPEKLMAPNYIADGLNWLRQMLQTNANLITDQNITPHEGQ